MSADWTRDEAGDENSPVRDASRPPGLDRAADAHAPRRPGGTAALLPEDVVPALLLLTRRNRALKERGGADGQAS